MPLTGEYIPSPEQWVRDQVDAIESSGGTEGNEMRGMAVVVVTMQGSKSGNLRKVPVMRVEHDGQYGIVASKGGAPENPVWYNNLVKNPHIELQDATLKQDMVVHELPAGSERDAWWDRAVAAYPDYADYQTKTDRLIPIFVAVPA